MDKTQGLRPEEIIEYLRKSRADDALLTVEEVIENHSKILTEWAERNVGGRVPEENRYKEVVSGETIADRPLFKEILKRIESPTIKAVSVVDISRISRGDLEDAGRIIKLFRYTNTLVITPTRVYDLRDEFDRDYFERELKRGNEYLEYYKKIQERGKLISLQSGNYLGNQPPYGYDKIYVMDGRRKCPTLAINEEQASVVRMIFDLYVNKNWGRKKIANHLDELGIKPPKKDSWSHSALADVLSNLHYTGRVRWNFRKTVSIVEDGEIKKTRPFTKFGEYLIYDGKHPAIIDDELFNAAQEKKGRNYRAKAATKVRNPLAGVVYCQCGRAMQYRAYNRKNGKSSEPRLLCDEQTRCNTGSCTIEEITDLVEGILKECIEDFEMRVKADNSDSVSLHESLINSLESKLAHLENKELALWDKYTEEGMPKAVFDKLKDKLTKEKSEVQTALCNAKESTPAKIDYQEKIVHFRRVLESLRDDNVPAEIKNKMLKSCFEKITYNRARAERVKRKPGEKKGSSLRQGVTWTKPPIHLDVTLKD